MERAKEIRPGKWSHYEEGEYTRFHNCEYVRKRNELIPKALEIAHGRIRVLAASEDRGESGNQWVKCFSTTMDSLTREAGLL